MVIDPAVTPLQRLRIGRCHDIYEQLFVLMTLGDERNISETWVNGERVVSGLTPQPVPLPEKNEKTHHTLFATLTQANPLQAGVIQAAPSLLRRRSELSKGMRVTRLRPSFFAAYSALSTRENS